MFKGIPKKDKDVIVAKVGNMLMQRAKRMYAAATLKAHIKVKGIYIDAILNSSVEVNVIIKLLANKARLTIQTNLMLALKLVLKDIRKFNRACKNIEVSISSISNMQIIIVIEDINYKLILKCLFFYNIQLTFIYNNNSY